MHAIAENIEVRYPFQTKTADDQIAKRAMDILTWDVIVPETVEVLVQDGWVTADHQWGHSRAIADGSRFHLSVP